VCFDRRWSISRCRYSDLDKWLRVHRVRAGDGLLRLFSSRVLLVDCLWAREVPLDVLEAVHFFIRAERGNESATLGLAVKTRYCLKVLISERDCPKRVC
jgi:hypothetical protein